MSAARRAALSSAALAVDSAGRALVRIKGMQVCFTVETADIDAPAGKGCIRTSAEVAAAIRVDPRGFSVDVHTAAFPDGAIRGQLQQGGAATP